jgi:TetR/AcrR family transcriptional regulator, cholesterol catabolism regulator
MTQSETVLERRLDDKEIKRRAIIETAADVFFERGFVAGTTKDVATRVGLSQPAIYHYVGSKATLLVEIAAQVDQDMRTALARALAESDDPRDQLVSLISKLTIAVSSNRRTFAVYWREMHQLPDDVRRSLRNNERAFVRRVEELVAAVQDQGGLPREAEARVVTEALLGMISWLYQWYQPTSRLTPADVASTFTDLVGLGRTC